MARVGSNPERPSLLPVQIIGMGLACSLQSAYQDLLRQVPPHDYPHDSEPMGTRGRPQRHEGIHRQREPFDRHRHRRALRLSAGASRTMDDVGRSNGYPRERHPEPRLLCHAAWLVALLAITKENPTLKNRVGFLQCAYHFNFLQPSCRKRDILAGGLLIVKCFPYLCRPFNTLMVCFRRLSSFLSLISW